MQWSLLTPREMEIVHLIGDAHNNESIASQLDVGIETVKSHLRAIFEKLGCSSRLEVCSGFLKWKFSNFDHQSH